jgi:DNA-binding CsgD family transcriptional regulator
MCRNGWCRDEVLLLLTDLLEAVGAGEVPQQALCIRVGEALDAATAAYVQFDSASRQCTLTCWPHTVDILRLKVVVDHLPGAYPLLLTQIAQEDRPSCVSADGDPHRWRGSEAELLLWEVLGCRDIAQVPLHVGPDQLRLLVLARRRSFTARDMHLLCTAQRPLTTLDGALRRGRWGPPALDPVHAAGFGDPGGEPGAAELTPREVEVLQMLAEGLLARTIATRMQVSPRTVHKHLGNVYRKLEAHDRLLAVHRAQAMGLIPAVLTSAGDT